MQIESRLQSNFQKMYHNQNFGMMDKAYFVPKSQILAWLNNLLQLNLTKIQQLGAGSVYCQVLDVVHPGTVSMNKVNWQAKNDYEFIANLKILQNGFAKSGIKKHLEVEKLARAKYQDNLEMIQWFKKYFDLNCGDRAANYNAQERRANAAVDFSFAEKIVVPKSYNSNGVIISTKNVSAPEKVKKQTANDDHAPIKTHQPKHQVKNTHKAVTSAVPKKSTLQKVQNSSKKQVNNNTDKLKDLEMKIYMIMEVLGTQDDSNLKIGLIEQILQFKKHSKKSISKSSPQHQQPQYQQKVQAHEDDVI